MLHLSITKLSVSGGIPIFFTMENLYGYTVHLWHHRCRWHPFWSHWAIVSVFSSAADTIIFRSFNSVNAAKLFLSLLSRVVSMESRTDGNADVCRFYTFQSSTHSISTFFILFSLQRLYSMKIRMLNFSSTAPGALLDENKDVKFFEYRPWGTTRWK